jgi:hypothetical protein
MKRIGIITLTWIIALSSLCHAQGIGHGIELRLTSQKLIEVEPGKILTGSFMISNRTAADIEVLESLVLPTIPEGWQPVIDYERRIVLGAGEEALRLVTLLVPAKCPAGEYEIIYSLIDLSNKEAFSSEAFSVIVVPVIKLDAVIEEKPEIVTAGDEYDVKLRLVNKGNSSASLHMQARTSPAYPVVIEPAETILEAGSSRIVHCTVATSASIKDKTNNVLEIDALVEVQGYGSSSVRRSALVEIIPKLAGAIIPRHSVPTSMAFTAVGNQDESGFQVEYSGNGSLDEAGSRRIDFLFRGPDVRDRSLYGTRDELRFRYSDRLLDISIGDKLYALSPLSERISFGRGGELRLTPGDAEIGAFYMETRWNVPEKEEMSFYAGYNSGDIFGIRGNFLRKHKRESLSSNGYEADLYTVQANFKPSRILNLGMEYGYSLNEGDTESEDMAHRITLDGEMYHRFWYTLENTYAGSRFFGYYNDAIYSNGTASALLYRNLRGSLSYRIYEYNLDLDQSKSTAPRERSIRGTLSYPFVTGTNLSIDYETLDRRDDLVPAQFDFEEDIWRLGAGQSIENFSIQIYAERAMFSDKLIDDDRQYLERYSVYTYYRPSPGRGLSLYTRIGHSSFTGNPQRTVSAGASASLRLGSCANWSLSYQSSNLSNEGLPRQDHLLSTFDIRLPNRHSVSLKARWYNMEDIDREDYSFIASYIIPLDLPALKKTSIGSLKGKIVDLDRAEEAPSRRIVLAAGDYCTATDENGEFAFPPMKTGTYSLQLDQRSMGLEKTATEPLPLSVEITGGETTYREIGISKACAISGRVVLMQLRPDAHSNFENSTSGGELFVSGGRGTRTGEIQKEDLEEVYGLDRVLVEISDGKETLSKRTDENGDFSFDGIRPGKWKVVVFEDAIPAFHHAEHDQYEIEAEAGVEYSIKVCVLPQLRTIRMIDGGEIAKKGY